jgi:dTDP-glucose 4,6-dehydratase
MAESILITGGAGFIGSNFVHHWRRGHPEDLIVVLDKLTYAADAAQIEGLERVTMVQADIQEGERVRALLERHGIRKVFHFAAESHVDRSISGPAAFIQTNLLGTFALLEAVRAVWAGEPDARFLHVSTDEVFGSLGAVGAFSELTPYAPNSPYSASKAGSDHLVRAYHHTYGLATITTNCSNNYGPRQHAEKLIPLAIARMAKGEPVPVYGDGQNIRDWLFVDDHCAALERAMAVGRPGETYCIGGGNEWKNLDLLHLLADLTDAELGRPSGTCRRLLTFVPDRAGHDRRYAIDARKIQAELGWKPKEAFAAGLLKTLRWYLGVSREST